jgi:hypothetical protein
MHSGNLYLNIFIVLNLYLTKLVQFDNQGLDFDYNYYNFLTIQVICGFYFCKIKILNHSSQFLM